jgi:hypothetical protein
VATAGRTIAGLLSKLKNRSCAPGAILKKLSCADNGSENAQNTSKTKYFFMLTVYLTFHIIKT